MIISFGQVLKITFLLCLCGQVANAQTLHLTKRTIYDSGFGTKMASHTILAPSNWTVEGNGYWTDSKYYSNVPSQFISMKSENGYAIQIGPIINASDMRLTSTGAANGQSRMAPFSADMGRVVIPRPDTIAEWKTFYEQELMSTLVSGKDATLTEVAEIPELTAIIEHQLAPTRRDLQARNRTMREMNIEQSCDGLAIGFRSRFEQAGRQMESLHVIMIATTYTRTQNYTKLEWNAVRDVRLVAPQGKLENVMPQMVAIVTSLRETPRWAQEKANHLGIIFQTQLKGIKERSRIMTEAHRDISNIIESTRRNINASNDRSHSRYIDAIREVEIYSHGDSSYELPSGYDHVYSDGSGNFILTNDHLLNPNTDIDTNSNWSSLSPIR